MGLSIDNAIDGCLGVGLMTLRLRHQQPEGGGMLNNEFQVTVELQPGPLSRPPASTPLHLPLETDQRLTLQPHPDTSRQLMGGVLRGVSQLISLSLFVDISLLSSFPAIAPNFPPPPFASTCTLTPVARFREHRRLSRWPRVLVERHSTSSTPPAITHTLSVSSRQLAS